MAPTSDQPRSADQRLLQRGGSAGDRPLTTPNRARLRGWLVDVLVGGVVGAIVGAVVAVNIVIYAGIDDGYEANLDAVFGQSVPVGVVTVAVLIGAPTLGVVVARRTRRKRLRSDGR